MDTFDNIIDRTGWPSGGWDHEPDRATWRHDETGAACTLRRGPLGAWCGYVGMGPNHPAAGIDYDNIDVSVHGGLTYGAYCHPIAEDEWIRYRLYREKWLTNSLIYPDGDDARYLREDRKGDTSTLIGFREWMRVHMLCHDDCPHGLWWVGFDTSHAWDTVPGLIKHYEKYEILHPRTRDGQRYWTFQMMLDETNRLAHELYEAKLITEQESR